MSDSEEDGRLSASRTCTLASGELVTTLWWRLISWFTIDFLNSFSTKT
jgi:hypothetical protein